MRPPRIPPLVPPGTVPGERRISYHSLLDKPKTLSEAADDAGELRGPLHLFNDDEAPLVIERTETSAAILELIALQRDDDTKGFIGLDADDHVVVLTKDALQAVAEFNTDQTNTDYSAAFARDAVAGAVIPIIAIKRQSTIIGFVGLDSSDQLALIAPDGTTLLTIWSPTGTLTALERVIASTTMKADAYHDTNDDQVVTTRQSAIPHVTATVGSPGGSDSTGGPPGDPATLGDVDGAYGATNALAARVADLEGTVADLVAAANGTLGALETHGLIDT